MPSALGSRQRIQGMFKPFPKKPIHLSTTLVTSNQNVSSASEHGIGDPHIRRSPTDRRDEDRPAVLSSPCAPMRQKREAPYDPRRRPKTPDRHRLGPRLLAGGDGRRGRDAPGEQGSLDRHLRARAAGEPRRAPPPGPP